MWPYVGAAAGFCWILTLIERPSLTVNTSSAIPFVHLSAGQPLLGWNPWILPTLAAGLTISAWLLARSR